MARYGSMGRTDPKAILEHLPRLNRYALFLTRDEDRRDELVQESLTKAISKLDQWEPGTNLRAWLLKIVHTPSLLATATISGKPRIGWRDAGISTLPTRRNLQN